MMVEPKTTIMPSLSWLEQVERRLARWAALGPGGVWVVGVSGGSDSVGLLHVLNQAAVKAGLRLSVAHLDHGARGEASREDAAFVERLAKALGLPFDLGRWQSSRPGHFEADARRARYQWLLETARARGATALAVGHTRDDQAETVLHRIIRGTGIHGLAGIPKKRELGPGVTLVRPLLDVSREQIRAYLETLGQPFREDASNEDASRTRARLRQDLLPKLAAEYNPRVAEGLVNLARLAKESMRANQKRLEEAEREAACVLPGERDMLRFDCERLTRYSSYLRAEVLRLAWRRVGWPEAGMDAKRWRRLALLTEGRLDVGSGVEARIEASLGSTYLVLRQVESAVYGKPAVLEREVALEMPGVAEWGDGRVFLSLAAAPDELRDETIDLDSVSPPLLVRGPLPGDRFGPLGMEGRAMSLNDFFRGRGVGREERTRTPLVCDRLGMIWVVGHRIADRVKLTETTTRRGLLKWERSGGCG